MAMDYFKAYHRYLQSVSRLSDAECGRLFRALLSYSAAGELGDLTGNERFLADEMISQIDRDKKKSNQNRENVMKRWNNDMRTDENAGIPEVPEPPKPETEPIADPVSPTDPSPMDPSIPSIDPIENNNIINNNNIYNNNIGCIRVRENNRERDKEDNRGGTGEEEGEKEKGKEGEEEGNQKPQKPKPPKIHYAEFVTMTEAEHSKLVEKYGESATVRMVEILDNYKGQNNRHYASDYRAILNWVVGRYQEEQTRGRPRNAAFPDSDYNDTEEDWMRFYQEGWQ